MPVGGTGRAPLTSVFFVCLESLPLQLGGLKAAVATGPAELLLGLHSLGKASTSVSCGDVGEQHTHTHEEGEPEALRR